MKREYRKYLKANESFNQRYGTTGQLSYEAWLAMQAVEFIGMAQAVH